ncbi:unnamed protein product [Peniophora sp. CBMAI 1063]|nr:unnamed protein product [Peniophora sp. CBMAI 1063]
MRFFALVLGGMPQTQALNNDRQDIYLTIARAFVLCFGHDDPLSSDEPANLYDIDFYNIEYEDIPAAADMPPLPEEEADRRDAVIAGLVQRVRGWYKGKRKQMKGGQAAAALEQRHVERVVAAHAPAPLRPKELDMYQKHYKPNFMPAFDAIWDEEEKSVQGNEAALASLKKKRGARLRVFASGKWARETAEVKKAVAERCDASHAELVGRYNALWGSPEGARDSRAWIMPEAGAFFQALMNWSAQRFGVALQLAIAGQTDSGTPEVRTLFAEGDLKDGAPDLQTFMGDALSAGKIKMGQYARDMLTGRVPEGAKAPQQAAREAKVEEDLPLDDAGNVFDDDLGNGELNLARKEDVEEMELAMGMGSNTVNRAPGNASGRAAASTNDVNMDDAYSSGELPPQTLADKDLASASHKERTFESRPNASRPNAPRGPSNSQPRRLAPLNSAPASGSNNPQAARLAPLNSTPASGSNNPQSAAPVVSHTIPPRDPVTAQSRGSTSLAKLKDAFANDDEEDSDDDVEMTIWPEGITRLSRTGTPETSTSVYDARREALSDHGSQFGFDDYGMGNGSGAEGSGYGDASTHEDDGDEDGMVVGGEGMRRSELLDGENESREIDALVATNWTDRRHSQTKLKHPRQYPLGGVSRSHVGGSRKKEAIAKGKKDDSRASEDGTGKTTRPKPRPVKRGERNGLTPTVAPQAERLTQLIREKLQVKEGPLTNDSARGSAPRTQRTFEEESEDEDAGPLPPANRRGRRLRAESPPGDGTYQFTEDGPEDGPGFGSGALGNGRVGGGTDDPEDIPNVDVESGRVNGWIRDHSQAFDKDNDKGAWKSYLSQSSGLSKRDRLVNAIRDLDPARRPFYADLVDKMEDLLREDDAWDAGAGGHLEKKDRPTQVSYMVNRRGGLLPDVVPEGWGKNMEKWWLALQPRERGVTNGVRGLAAPHGSSDWGSLLIARGYKGAFLLVWCMMHWAISAKDMELWQAVVEDMTAVFVVLKNCRVGGGISNTGGQVDNGGKKQAAKRAASGGSDRAEGSKRPKVAAKDVKGKGRSDGRSTIIGSIKGRERESKKPSQYGW